MALHFFQKSLRYGVARGGTDHRVDPAMWANGCGAFKVRAFGFFPPLSDVLRREDTQAVGAASKLSHRAA